MARASTIAAWQDYEVLIKWLRKVLGTLSVEVGSRAPRSPQSVSHETFEVTSSDLWSIFLLPIKQMQVFPSGAPLLYAERGEALLGISIETDNDLPSLCKSLSNAVDSLHKLIY